MRRSLSRLADWLMRRRSSLPSWVNRAMESVARNPDGLLGRLAGGLLKGEDPPATTLPDASVRLYIAPTNYSGQGYAWARAVEDADPEIGARNMAVEIPGGYGFPADTVVPITTLNSSDAWAEAEWNAVRGFTHVLVEAERSMFGRRFGRDLRAEISALEEAGLAVAYLCHGSDIRDPHAHAARTPWSPYPEYERTDLLHADAVQNLRLLEEVRHPVFVSTPDLIDDVPWAVWCPVVVDAQRFRTPEPFANPTVGVLHAASSTVEKGTHLIEPVIADLTGNSEVRFTLATSTSSSKMPELYAEADIVLDQFRVGSYGVAACEAMAAGRVVVGHVLPHVRARVVAEYGIELPIVEATPDTLHGVLTDLIADRECAARIAARGPAYVSAVHHGRASARALIDNWLRV